MTNHCTIQQKGGVKHKVRKGATYGNVLLETTSRKDAVQLGSQVPLREEHRNDRVGNFGVILVEQLAVHAQKDLTWFAGNGSVRRRK